MVIPSLRTFQVIPAIYYVYPLLNILYFLLALSVSACVGQTRSSDVKDEDPRRRVILIFMFGVVCECIIQILLLSVHSFIPTATVASHDEIVYLLFSVLIWAIQFIVLAESKLSVWYPYYINWVTAILLEITLLLLRLDHKPIDAFDSALISIQCLRICNLTALTCLHFLHYNSRGTCTEYQSLRAEDNTIEYGATATVHNGAEIEQDDEQPSQADDKTWWERAKEFKIFLPYVWPDERSLQFRIVLLALYPFASNALNILVPRQFGNLIDFLASGDKTKIFTETTILGLLWLLDSNVGIKWLRVYLWKPVQIYSYEAINTAAHSHVMSLSADFHENKEPSAICTDIDQGQSITSLVESVCFKLVPVLLDFCIGFVFLYSLFGSYMAFNVAFTALFYLYWTVKLIRRAMPYQEDYCRYWRKEKTSRESTIDCWQLASYNNNILFEHKRYSSDVQMHSTSRGKYVFTLSFTSAFESVIINIGQIVGCLIAIHQVTHKTRSVGDVAFFLSRWTQLASQLSFLSDSSVSILEEMTKAKRLLEIFQTKPSIFDSDDAKTLHLQNGNITFTNVDFSYNSQNLALRGVSFSIPGGSRVGIVGESGSGKSTIIKLLTRFYEIKNGSITIDGQDIREVTLESLRKNIGVVHQETTLFNSTIYNNAIYTRRDASAADVENACKKAAIHKRIMSIPNAYNAEVGSRGVKLSGGERQRIAIARVILKGPPILLLDEATSALDSISERDIQKALSTLSRKCTVLTIAHRLSTIMDADLIVVMHDGAVVEQGTHNSLLEKNGQYRKLWDAQAGGQYSSMYDVTQSLTFSDESLELDRDPLRMDPLDWPTVDSMTCSRFESKISPAMRQPSSALPTGIRQSSSYCSA